MTVRLILDTRYLAKDGTCPILIRVRLPNQRIPKDIKTYQRCKPEHWQSDKVSKKVDNYDLINIALDQQFSMVKRQLLEAQIKSIDLESVLPEKKTKQSKVLTLQDYLQGRQDYYLSIGKAPYSNHIKVLKSEIDACFRSPVKFTDIDDLFAEKLHLYLINEGNNGNTIANKFKKLKNFIEKSKLCQNNPFIDYKVDKVPINKEKLTFDEIKALECAKLTIKLGETRDLFLFSFYFKGLRFKNCCETKTIDVDLNENRIYCNEISKSGKRVSAPLNGKLKSIVMKYYNPENEYLFEFAAKDTKSYNVIANRNIKLICASIGIKSDISFHNARHSFAFAMKSLGANVSAIKDMLGHGDTKITEIYLKELDDSYLDVHMNELYGE